jgi:hypothetical protein
MSNTLTLRIIIIVISLFLLLACKKQSADKHISYENILAIVADDTIYANDFISRCEYNVRPDFCQNNGYHDKAICLNSMIGEKLLAMENKENRAFASNQWVQEKLKGIQEQAMREILIREQVVDKIKIPAEEVKQGYINSQKNVFTESVFIPENIDPLAVYQAACQGIEIKSLKEKYPGVSQSYENEVKWGQMDETIQQAIYSKEITKGSLIKPLKTSGGYWLIKVKSWTETVELSPGNRDQQMENIRAKLKDYYIRKNYYQYASEMMKGKRIDFVEDSWKILVSILQPVYVKNEADNLPSAAEIGQIDADLLPSADKTLMSIDGELWMLDDLRKAIRIHPLVINTQRITKENFPKRLQAAIAGLITDMYLTKQAYERKLERSKAVLREVKTWETYLSFLNQRDTYLLKKGFKGVIGKDYFEVFDNYLNPYLDTLKAKYNEVVRYNPDLLKEIELTRIPMVMHHSGGPYTQVVPPFPLLTNAVKTNYQRLKL